MHKDMFKTLSFAALHFTVGFGVSYAFTGSVAIAGGIALVEPLANTVVFFFHERAWNRLEDRRRPHGGLPGIPVAASPSPVS
jgi:uncharacterized membrane protein